MRTRSGYSFITPQFQPNKGLSLTGLLATKPYRIVSFPTATSSFSISDRAAALFTSSGKANAVAFG